MAYFGQFWGLLSTKNMLHQAAPHLKSCVYNSYRQYMHKNPQRTWISRELPILVVKWAYFAIFCYILGHFGPYKPLLS